MSKLPRASDPDKIEFSRTFRPRKGLVAMAKVSGEFDEESGEWRLTTRSTLGFNAKCQTSVNVNEVAADLLKRATHWTREQEKAAAQ